MTALALLAALALVAQPTGPDPFEGLWRSTTDEATIRLFRCGVSLCGQLIGSGEIADDPKVEDSNNRDPALRTRLLKGLTILSGFTRQGEAWTGGRIYDPDDGNTYRSSLRIEDGVLIVKGCVAAGLICRSERWKRPS